MDKFLQDIVDFTKKIEKFNQKIAKESLSRPECSCRECSEERDSAKKALSR